MTRPRRSEKKPAEASPVSAPIIRTKLHRPPVTADLVSRNRLLERLRRSLEAPLTLVSAPAGYGKSVLVSQWIEQLERPCAWLSLDQGDRDLRVFLQYLVAAVDGVSPGACPFTTELAAAPELPAVRVVAGHLMNELDALDEPCVVVLDDYHQIDPESPVHELLGRLLEHPPRRVHLVLTTRRDPPLPLAGLRAGNRVIDVRLQDLRFTGEETAAFLAATASLAVSEEALENLEHEVEGWAVGLRLVSLALRHAEDKDAFVKQLRGGLLQTQEYLIEEVLAAQPPEVTDCMLKASVLDRFCAPLLDAVCASGDGPARPGIGVLGLVDLLQQSNLFTIPLDARGEWFRYHHLFRDSLRRHLGRLQAPSAIAALHARASEWFESRELITEAIEHALAAGEVVRAAEIVERHRRARLEEDRWLLVKGWLDRLPAEIKQQRLDLLLSQAWVAYYRLELAHAQLLVERIESLLGDSVSETASMAELSYFRSVLRYWEGDGEESVRCCEEALARYPVKRGVIAGEIQVYQAVARQMIGEGEPAVEALEDECAATEPAEHLYLTRMAAGQAFVHLLSGDPVRAAHAARRVGFEAEQIPSTYAQNWGHYLQALARLHSLLLDDALRGFRFVAERRDVFERRAATDALAGLVLTHQLRFEPERARSAAAELIAFSRELGEPEFVDVAESCRARLSLLQGDLDPAVDWARSIDAELHAPSMFLWLEIPSITVAKVRIAEGTEESLHLALTTLGALRPQVERLHATCHTIEIAVLQCVALEKQGSTDEALAALEEALALAGPGGWIRPFVEAGPAMAGPLRRLRRRSDGGGFIDRVLAAFPGRAAPAPSGSPVLRTVEPRSAKYGPGPDALTNRELDILELLAQRLSNKEIGANLFVSTHTVNDHLKHIYQKLDVHTRRQAVHRAVELGIIRPR